MQNYTHQDTVQILLVREIGSYIKQNFDGSLHRFSDDGQQAGVIYPHGLWYVGPVSREKSGESDDTHLKIVFDDTLLTLTDIQAFLANYGIDTILPL